MTSFFMSLIVFFNLLFVTRLAKSHYINATLLDQMSSQTIDIGCESHGLYYVSPSPLLCTTAYSNLLDLLLKRKHLIWNVIYASKSLYGFWHFKLLSTSLEWYIILFLIVILSKDVSISLYMWTHCYYKARQGGHYTTKERINYICCTHAHTTYMLQLEDQGSIILVLTYAHTTYML